MNLKQAVIGLGDNEEFLDDKKVMMVSHDRAIRIPWRLAKEGQWFLQLTETNPETVVLFNTAMSEYAGKGTQVVDVTTKVSESQKGE